jgi:hypothetical protein
MRSVLIAVAVVCLAGCGVTTQDRPDPITTPVPTATPTVTSRPASSTPCTPTSQSSGSRQVQPTSAPTQ